MVKSRDSNRKIVLAVESSTARGSVALYRGHTQLSLNQWERQGARGEALTPAIESCLKSGQIKVEEINFFAVDTGPGSFTGIRVALNAVRSLAYSMSKPIFATSSLRIMAEAVPTEKPILTLLNSYDNGVFFAIYRRESMGMKALHAPCTVALSEIENLIPSEAVCVGDGYELLRGHMRDEVFRRLHRVEGDWDYPTAQALATLAIETHDELKFLRWDEVQPVYLRSSSAEEKLKKRT